MTLGERIMYARKKTGMSQIDLADALEVSRQSVSKWETGESSPEVNRLKKLSDVLGVSVDWLLSDDDIEDLDIEVQYTAPIQQNQYPKWLNSLPGSISRLAKKYGWLYGVYVAVGGGMISIVCIAVLKAVYDSFFGTFQWPSEIDGIHIDFVVPAGMEDPGYTAISTILGLFILAGIGFMILGIIIAISLRKWGKQD